MGNGPEEREKFCLPILGLLARALATARTGELGQCPECGENLMPMLSMRGRPTLCWRCERIYENGVVVSLDDTTTPPGPRER